MTFDASALPGRLDADESLALPTLLRTRGQDCPDRIFLRNVDGSDLSYGDLERRVQGWMAALALQGVGPGDRVATLLPPSFDAVAVWMAAARLGAIETPMNTALKGEFLAHVIRNAAPSCIVAASAFLGQLDEVVRGKQEIPRVLLAGDEQRGTSVVNPVVPSLDDEFDGEECIARPHDIATIVYTSGTSGRSKGVLVPWAQAFATARWLMPLEGREGDVWYGPWAMFHVSGKVGLYSSALLDGQLVIRDGFSTSNFWTDVRHFGVTSTMIVASTVAFLSRQDPTETDRAHSLRNVCAAPMPEDPDAFSRRFGVKLCTVFNMTETASPISTGWDPAPSGSCGTARPGVEVRIVDEHGADVPTGTAGELLLRAAVPHETMAGYWKAPEATVEAWQDLWFHTGDSVRRDNLGHFYFLDRLKDTIRRGGENISSTELEAAVNEHPLVRESAAIGVPAAWGDLEVKLFIVPEVGFDAEELAAYLDSRLPRFMRPSLITVVDSLPKTHTARIQKAQLRALVDDRVTWARQRTNA